MSEDRMITPEELRVAFRQAVKNLERYAKSVGVDLEPQLIQGYTAENWNIISCAKYLVEVWDRDQDTKIVGTLAGIYTGAESHPFIIESGSRWRFCRPAQIKGVMRPIFVEPVDDGVMCCLFDKDNYPLNNTKSRMAYAVVMQGGYPDATKYIEL